MKLASAFALSMALATGAVTFDAEARRLGGGKSFGMQRQTPARTAPDAVPAKPAAPAQQAAPAAGPNAAGAAAAAPKRNWMGPLAGLAAGLGLAALMSHLGLGGAFGSFLLMMLLVLAGVVVVRMIMRRRQAVGPTDGNAYRASNAGGAQVAWPSAGSSSGTAMPGSVAAEAAAAAAAGGPAGLQASTDPASETPSRPRAFVPASFDAESFGRTAKMIYIRLQAANDAGDKNDLRAFTTPEMFAELSLDLQDRGGAAQVTEVLSIEAEVLDVADEPERQVVSVRMRGQVRETPAAAPVAVDEVWHLVKPADGSHSWAIAGIEQWQ
jgi:predicted lipid-binding transport protein (Tim44 family)